MTVATLRRVQPAHKSKKVTVSQARKAWLKLKAREGRLPAETERAPRSGESAPRERTGG